MKNNHIRLLFALVVIVLLAVSVLNYYNLENYVDQVARVRHSNRVLRALQTVLSSVKDAEIGHRGFQLTRDTTYLDPYYRSVAAVPGQIDLLDSLFVNDSAQASRVDTLKRLITNQFSVISQILSNARRSSLYMDSFESNLLQRGKTNMDDIRGMVKKINDQEEEQFLSLVSQEQGYRNTAPIALLGLTVLSLAGMSLLFSGVLDALNKKRIAEGLLKENLEKLRQEVSLRTSQQRVSEERAHLLKEAEALANMGSWKWFAGTGKFIWSESLYRILGTHSHSNNLSWDSFLENTFPDDRNAVEQFLIKIKKVRERDELNFRIHLEGHIKYLQMLVHSGVDGATNSGDILGTVIDVTAEKIQETQLKKFMDELQRSNQDLEQFAYVASHDLQEPLRKIRAFGDLLNTKYQDKLDSTGSSYIARMHSAAERMQVLIEDLLTFSRVSRTGLRYEEVNLNAIFTEVLEDLDWRIKQDHAVVEAGSLPKVRGERGQLKRLFQNLLTNALKFHKADEHPRVKVTGSVVTSRDIELEFNMSLESTLFCRICIQDNGIGFEQKYAERIFNIFQRLHGPLDYEGTGIGLAICRKIVTNHGGAIRAKSVVDVGSEFIFALPIE